MKKKFPVIPEYKKVIGKGLLAVAGGSLLDQIIANQRNQNPILPSQVAPVAATIGIGLLILDKQEKTQDMIYAIDSIVDDSLCILEEQFGDEDLDLEDDDYDEEVEAAWKEHFDDLMKQRPSGFQLDGTTDKTDVLSAPPAEAFWKDIEVDDDTPAPSSFVGTNDEWEKVSLQWKKYFLMLQRISDMKKNEASGNSEEETASDKIIANPFGDNETAWAWDRWSERCPEKILDIDAFKAFYNDFIDKYGSPDDVDDLNAWRISWIEYIRDEITTSDDAPEIQNVTPSVETQNEDN